MLEYLRTELEGIASSFLHNKDLKLSLDARGTIIDNELVSDIYNWKNGIYKFAVTANGKMYIAGRGLNYIHTVLPFSVKYAITTTHGVFLITPDNELYYICNSARLQHPFITAFIVHENKVYTRDKDGVWFKWLGDGDDSVLVPLSSSITDMTVEGRGIVATIGGKNRLWV